MAPPKKKSRTRGRGRGLSADPSADPKEGKLMLTPVRRSKRVSTAAATVTTTVSQDEISWSLGTPARGAPRGFRVEHPYDN